VKKNSPKSAKIGINQKKYKKYNVTMPISYNELRRLGNSEVLPANP